MPETIGGIAAIERGAEGTVQDLEGSLEGRES